VVAGVKKPQTSVSLPSMLMLQNEITLRGVWARPSWAITRALQLLASEPRFADLIEDHYPLDRAGAALDDMQSSHRSLHGVVVPQHER
jgi:threonine dehydrogenase-like Zn-dependent dehydrogenase